jgi:hypothetical protein
MPESKDKCLDARFQSLPAHLQAAVAARPQFPTRREKRLAVALYGGSKTSLDLAKELLAERRPPALIGSSARARALRKVAAARGFLFSVEWSDGVHFTYGEDFLSEEEARAFFDCLSEDVLHADYARAILDDLGTDNGVYVHLRLTSSLMDSAGKPVQNSGRLLDARYAAKCGGCGAVLAADGIPAKKDGLRCAGCSGLGKRTTPASLQRVLDKQFGGVLHESEHKQGSGRASGLELLSVARGAPWTSAPEKVRCFDLGPLNNIQVSPETRAKHLLPVLSAYDGSLDWTVQRKQRVAERLAILTVQRIVSGLPGLSPACRKRCREVSTLAEAAKAASAASAESQAAAKSEARESPASALWAAKAAKAASVALAKMAAENAASAASVALTQRAASESAESAHAAVRASAEAARTAASAEVKAVKAAATGIASLAARERIFILACALFLEAAD